MISLIFAMVSEMPPIDCTACAVEACIAATWAEISSVAFAVWLASAFTSEATTAKPRPDSPARAASMVAFSANRLVCEAIEWISCTTSPIFSAPVDSICTVALVCSASVTARLATSRDCATWRAISPTELDSSSAAAATVPTVLEADADAAPTVAAREEASLAVEVIDCAVVCMFCAADATDCTMPLTLRSKSPAISCIAWRRSFGRALLRLGFDLLQPADADSVVLEHLHRLRHRTDLVAAVDAGNGVIELAFGERTASDRPARRADG